MVLLIPQGWWDAANPETRAKVRNAALREINERAFEMRAEDTETLHALLLRDYTNSQATLPERAEKEKPEPGTTNVVRRGKRKEKAG